MADELKFVRVETDGVGCGAERFVEVPPFSHRLGNVLRCIGDWSVKLSLLAVLFFGALVFIAYLSRDERWFSAVGEAFGGSLTSVVLCFFLLFVPCRVLDYLLTGRK